MSSSRVVVRHSTGLVGVLLLAAIAGCSSNASTVVPNASGSPGLASHSTSAPTPAASPTGSVLPSPTPDTTPSLGAPLRWERVQDQAAFDRAAMVDVVAGPDRYVAVGCTTTAASFNATQCSGVSWTSRDGVTWNRSGVPDANPLYLQGVIAAPIGFLAWAYDLGENPGAAFWVSRDGSTWRRAASIPSFSFSLPGGAVWYRDRFIGFGANPGAGRAPGMWTSSNGLDWSDQPATDCGSGEALELPPDTFFGSGSGVTVFGNDLLLWTTTYSEAEGHRRVTARSNDGVCWTPSEAPSDGFLFDVAGVRDRLVACGTSHDVPDLNVSLFPRAAAWTSSDGSSWAAASYIPPAPNAYMYQMASGDRGLLARGDSEAGATFWRSLDGGVWTTEASRPDWVSSIASIPDGFIGVGYGVPCPIPGDCAPGPCVCIDGGFEHMQAVVWIAH